MCGRFLWCGVLFLLWLWILLVVSEHGERSVCLGVYPYLFYFVFVLHPASGRACNIPKVRPVGGLGACLAPKYCRCFHCVCPPVVWFLLWLFCGYFEGVHISAGRFCPSAGFLCPKLAASFRPCSGALFIGFLGFFSEILEVCAVVVLV